MTEEQITMGSILLNKKKMLMSLRDRVRESFQDLNVNSSDEDVARFITNIIKMGYKDSLWPSILRMVGDIDRDIIDLDDKIRRL